MQWPSLQEFRTQLARSRSESEISPTKVNSMVTKPLLGFQNRGDYYELQHNDECSCKNSNSSWTGSCISGAKTSSRRRRIQFGWFGLFMFLLALVSSFYLVWKWHEYQEAKRTPYHELGEKNYDTELKLVSLFNRHGDRAPAGELPDVDKHKEALTFFWPNGLGLALRQMYGGQFGYDYKKVLAFSSTTTRCIETIQMTLKGFYELEGPKSRGLQIIADRQRSNCSMESCNLPDGSGSPDEWKLIPLDTDTFPTLSEQIAEKCRYWSANPSPLVENLMLHPQVRALPGIDKLQQVLERRYGFPRFGGSNVTSIFSTIRSELNLVRTRESIRFADHYSDWVNEVVACSPDGMFNITLFDVFEQASVFMYRDQTLGVTNWLEIGPMLTSLIDSQLVASQPAGGQQPLSLHSEAGKAGIYADKHIVFYSSHDSILQRILYHLDLIQFNDHLTYVERFTNCRRRGGDVFDRFMSGLTMSCYGVSIKFDLLEAKLKPTVNQQSSSSLVYVELSLYNQEEARFGGIVYRPLELGEACVRLFKRKYPAQANSELDRFYNYDFSIDWRFGCPFELFRNVTADLMVEEAKFKELC